MSMLKTINGGKNEKPATIEQITAIEFDGIKELAAMTK